MTPNTQQQELDELAQMSQVVCSTCSGETSITGYGFVPRMCDNCNGSGRKWEGFSRECPCIYIPGDGSPAEGYECRHCFRQNQHEPEGCNCQGSGRVPVSVAEAVLWGLAWLIARGIRMLITNEGISFGTKQFVGNYKYTQAKTFGALALFAAMKEVE